MNQVNLVGRMTRDAEEFGNPPIGVRFAVATEDYDFGTKQRETEFHECVAFGKVTEVIKQYAGKGREVRVTGKKKTRKYQAQKGVHAGHEVDQVVVIVDDFELLAGMPATQQGNFQGGPSAGPQDANPSGW